MAHLSDQQIKILFFIVLIAGREDFFSQGPLHTDWNGLSCYTEDSGLSLLITMQLMQLTHLNRALILYDAPSNTFKFSSDFFRLHQATAMPHLRLKT